MNPATETRIVRAAIAAGCLSLTGLLTVICGIAAGLIYLAGKL